MKTLFKWTGRKRWPLGIAALLIVIGVIWSGLEGYIKPSTPTERKDFVQTVFQVLGGTSLLTGAYFAWRQLQGTQENLRLTQENLRIAQEGQITERFTRAIEQLSSSKLEICLGGIYALERIAKDSEKDHWVIMEVLTSFVQEKSPLPNPGQQLQKVTTDIQAVLTAIGRRDASKDPKDKRLDLSNTNLSGANLSEANLSGANFFQTNLSGANFRGAVLFKTSFRGADLSGAFFSFSNLKEANLKEADFNGADFNGAILNGATLNGAILTKAVLVAADLTGANFAKANLVGADLQGANLSKANLNQADLSGANNLTASQVQSALNWKSAKYDRQFCNALGLP